MKETVRRDLVRRIGDEFAEEMAHYRAIAEAKGIHFPEFDDPRDLKSNFLPTKKYTPNATQIGGDSYLESVPQYAGDPYRSGRHTQRKPSLEEMDGDQSVFGRDLAWDA